MGDSEVVFHSVHEAIKAIRDGEMVLVMDDENRENEGDLVMAAQHATAEQLAFFIKHTSGIICAPMTLERSKELQLGPMVAANQDGKGTAFTVTCDRKGVTTGVSARDRALTLRALGEPGTQAADLTRPGHIFPLTARAGGVFERRGHTEACVDLCRLAGLEAVGVIGELTDASGGMMRLPACFAFARIHALKLITIEALCAYRTQMDGAAFPALRSEPVHFSPIAEAIDALQKGEIVVVMDDEERENEGDLVMAAQHATADKLRLFIRHTSGIICAPMPLERAAALALPPMLAHNEDGKGTAFTVTCDAKGVSTGVSAADRALTLRCLAAANTHAGDITRPGHVFPLTARAGGVFERRGHTEASVDLCSLAGLAPVAVIGELTHDDGSMMRLPACDVFARKHGMKLVTIEALVAYRRHHSPDVGRTSPSEQAGEHPEEAAQDSKRRKEASSGSATEANGH